ncbi:hypothetical protein [Bifidobacterium leontopitheci]|uniref:Abortive phage infection protein n=1 Tax=Bifidobacterium leontopitheci TaxID=2650774 RepID=A0A6I1GDG1_9BIFI|nr:hypothetical protein [Bifidobacterium leontopitheci]KAB7789680.1 hypothetical protein F7D09_1814 [Bifidobacterium leontopitheci]
MENINKLGASEGITIRFEKSVKQSIGETTKIVGMVRAKYLIPVIDHLNLQANPRDSKTGPVTKAIQRSIDEDPMLFPFKTKGLLLAASNYEEMDRGRVRVIFRDLTTEGILDGGHNTLAIGLLILERAVGYARAAGLTDVKLPSGAKTWGEFKQLWAEYRDLVQEYQAAVRKDETANSDSEPQGEDLSFYVPVELLVPTDPTDPICVENFSNNLLEICVARNNNAELNASAKANQKGYFRALADALAKANQDVSDRIEWKTNDGGDIKVQDLIALTWIVLRWLCPVEDSDGKKVEAPAASKLYSGKGACLALFERFMSSESVTSQDHGSYRHGLRNETVRKAFSLAAQIPALYDRMYAEFPSLYNQAGGSYGRITAVKNLNARTSSKVTPFAGTPVDVVSPDGFITPLVYGLTALVNPETMEWRTDPDKFLDKWLPAIVNRYSQVFVPCDYDPQKVGKSAVSYSTVEDSYKMALAGIL